MYGLKRIDIMKPIKLFVAILSVCFAAFTTGYSSNDKTNALLWKVSGNGLEKPSYILGTLHVAPKAKLDSIPGAMQMLESCERVVGELVMSDAMAQISIIQQAGMMPTDTTYEMLYTEDEYQKVSNGIKECTGVGLDHVSMFKPGMIRTSVSLFMCRKYFPDFDVNEAMDNYVQQYAYSVGKDVIGLETIDDQIDALYRSSSLKRQAELLLCLFEYFEETWKSSEKLIDAYNSADLAAIEAISNDVEDPCPSTQTELDALNKNRNDNWIKKLPEIMSEKSSFIAVGAAHLVGESGLLTQLEKLGYKIEPVK